MTRPALPPVPAGDSWGGVLNAAVNDVSDRADQALARSQVIVLGPDDPDPTVPVAGALYVRLSPPPDTSAPSVPTGLGSSGVTSTGFTFTWAESSDDSGAGGIEYEVQVNGTTVATVMSTSWVASGRTPSTAYTLRVRAVDLANNASGWSSDYVITTGAAVSGTARHTIWGQNAPAGTWGAHTDGGNIEYGNGFYRYGTGVGTFPSMRVIGARVYKPPGVTLPGGNVTVSWYLNPGPLPLPCPASGFSSDNVAEAVKAVATAGFLDGWNEVLLDTPLAMPGNGGVVVITVRWSNVDFYMINTGARVNNNFLPAADGIKLCWSDNDEANGYSGALWRIGAGYGIPAASGVSYGTDIIVDEGP